MAKGRQSKGKPDRRSKEATTNLPPGVKLVRTLEGHKGTVFGVSFSPDGRWLASGSYDNTVRLWEAASGKELRQFTGNQNHVCSVSFSPDGRWLASGSGDNTVRLWEAASGKELRQFTGHQNLVCSVSFSPDGRWLASGSYDNTVRLWEAASGKELRQFTGRPNPVYSVSFSPDGRWLASGSYDNTVRLWEAASGKELRQFTGHPNPVRSVSFSPDGRWLASGSDDNTVRLWEASSGKLLRTLEGHTGSVSVVDFSKGLGMLASKSDDGTVRLWNCESWECVVVIPTQDQKRAFVAALCFHPTLPWLAMDAPEPGVADDQKSRLIRLWELDVKLLLGEARVRKRARRAVHHTTARIVLVGDSGVGKTGLGWRLAHGEFKEHSSTHGQQFWVLDQLRTRRKDGTACEAILWDLAGQPDYRLTHALFLDDADLAMVLFDPTDSRDPLHGVEFWLRQLRVGEASRGPVEQSRTESKACPAVLVAARCDRGMPTLSQEDLNAFVRKRGLSGYVRTSAKSGEGLAELLDVMNGLILWEEKDTTVTTVAFKRIKDYVLELKENPRRRKVILGPGELHQRLERTRERWKFTDAERMTAVGHLETYGYVKRLHTSKGEVRILLVPELLNNLAASFVLHARANPKGLGSLEEKRLLACDYPFPELKGLTQDEQDILVDSAALLFIEHHVCFRETDPLTQQSYLVFPELINLKRPVEEDKPTEDAVAYTVSGATENVFASLVVLLGYTHTFTRTNQWQSHARYEVGDGLVCGFREDADREGELDFVLYFCPDVPARVRTLFQSLFENFLARRNLTVMRYEPVICGKCRHSLDRGVVRERSRAGKDFAFCAECGERLSLPKQEAIQLTREQQAEVDVQRRVADNRTRFEQAIFRVQSYVTEQKIKVPECFISYAWGTTPEEKGRERWVERSLATDLQKAGIKVVLDRWHNAQIGASVPRFIERIEKCDRIVTVGTPLYRRKYENKDTNTGYVVAAEVDLINNRLVGTEPQKTSVLPLLLDGEKTDSLPPLLHGRIYADFRKDEDYFITAFDLILSLYGIAPSDPAVVDLRESLQGPRLR